MTDPAIPDGLAEVLLDIGMAEPDMTVPLHVKLIDAMRRLGPHATHGARVVAMRYIFNWELDAAGSLFAEAKTKYETFIDRETLRLRATDDSGKLSRVEAEQMARASDRAYDLKLTYLTAEQRERSMRNFLVTLEKDLDNHRTDRADWRAADRAHAQGLDGGA